MINLQETQPNCNYDFGDILAIPPRREQRCQPWSARPYPPEWADMTRDERNTFFAEEARDYREAPKGRAKPTLNGDGEAHARAYDAPGKVAPRKPKMEIEWFSEAADSALNAPVNPLIEDLLDEGALSVIYGDSGNGKTFAALDMGFHVGAGLDWNGKKVTRGLVVYVAAEGGKRIKRRIAALKKRYREEFGEHAVEPLFALVRYQIDLRSNDADRTACSPLSAPPKRKRRRNVFGSSSTRCRGDGAMSRLMLKSAKRASLVENLRSLRGLDKMRVR